MRDNWRIDDPEATTAVPSSPQEGLVSLHFLVGAVRRRWAWVAAAGLAGVLLAVMGAAHVTQASKATVTLLVAEPADVEPSTALATDVSLLRTRAVAQMVLDRLDLPGSPEGLQGAIVVDSATPQILKIDVAATSANAAVELAQTVADVFLKFRATERNAQAQAVIDGEQQAIHALSEQVKSLTKQYEAVSLRTGNEQQAAEILTQRGQLLTKINVGQQTIDDTQLEADAINKATHVVDEAAPIPRSRTRVMALAIASGLVGGLMVGLGLVLTLALLTDRLRRRAEIAHSLRTSVMFSAGNIRRRPWPLHRSSQRRLDHLVAGLATALPEGPGPRRLALAAVDCPRDAARILRALADSLTSDDTSVAVVDLSESEWFSRRRHRMTDGKGPVPVRRRDIRVTPLGPAADRLGTGAAVRDANVVLTLVELDLGGGLELVADLCDATVVLVRAGTVSAERLRSSAALLRQTGLVPRFAMVVGADRTDDSSGLVSSEPDSRRSVRRTS